MVSPHNILINQKGKNDKFSVGKPGNYYLNHVITNNINSACMLSRAQLQSCHISCVQLFVTLWTVARQVPLSVGFPRQEHWSGLPCPPPRGSSQPRNGTQVSYISCTDRCVLYHYQCHVGKPIIINSKTHRYY